MTATVSHADIVDNLAPEARRKRFHLRWIRRRAPT
jgi:hypothetical protein